MTISFSLLKIKKIYWGKKRKKEARTLLFLAVKNSENIFKTLFLKVKSEFFLPPQTLFVNIYLLFRKKTELKKTFC